MDPTTLRDEIHKRLTLNWLIQGASQHAGMTLHYLVRDELDAIDPDLLHLYDQFALINLLQYWHLDCTLVLGWPPRFWRRAATDPAHPFFGHALLARHGGALAEAARRRALARSREKRVARLPVLFSLQGLSVLGHLRAKEAHHRRELIELAKQSAALVWGVPIERLDADLTRDVAFGDLTPPRSFRAAVLRAAVVGYGGVVRRCDSLVVVAKGANWHLLARELIKGTAELICLHGLNALSDDIYEGVLTATDRIEFEPWMLHTGGELWRRLLAVAPGDRPMAEILMHLARLPARSLEALMLAVIERPDWARELLAGLGASQQA
jgi:hypothetical protein